MDGPMTRHVERQATRMAEMMQRLHVDVLELVHLSKGAAYAEARERCLRCGNARECLLWLDARPASHESPSFCPNVVLFETCKTTSRSES
jgi:hypothetical protein